MSDEPRTKKARKRPRTKRARQEVRQNVRQPSFCRLFQIERALASTKSGLAERLKSEGGTLPMQEVLSHVAGADQSDVGKLSAAQLTSLSNASRMFEVAPATNGELRLALKSEERESVQDTFVYVVSAADPCAFAGQPAALLLGRPPASTGGRVRHRGGRVAAQGGQTAASLLHGHRVRAELGLRLRAVHVQGGRPQVLQGEQLAMTNVS